MYVYREREREMLNIGLRSGLWQCNVKGLSAGVSKPVVAGASHTNSRSTRLFAYTILYNNYNYNYKYN